MRARVLLIVLLVIAGVESSIAQVHPVEIGSFKADLTTVDGGPGGRLLSMSSATFFNSVDVDLIQYSENSITYDLVGYYETATVRHIITLSGQHRISIGFASHGQIVFAVNSDPAMVLTNSITDCSGLTQSYLFRAIADHNKRFYKDVLPTFDVIDPGTTEIPLVESYVMATGLVQAIPELIGCGDFSPSSGLCNNSDFENCMSCCITEDGLGDVLMGAIGVAVALWYPPAGVPGGLGGILGGFHTSAQSCIDTYCEGLGGDPSPTVCGPEDTGICAVSLAGSCWVGPGSCPPPMQCWCSYVPLPDECDPEVDTCPCDPFDPCCPDDDAPCCVNPLNPNCAGGF